MPHRLKYQVCIVSGVSDFHRTKTNLLHESIRCPSCHYLVSDDNLCYVTNLFETDNILWKRLHCRTQFMTEQLHLRYILRHNHRARYR